MGTVSVGFWARAQIHASFLRQHKPPGWLGLLGNRAAPATVEFGGPAAALGLVRLTGEAGGRRPDGCAGSNRSNAGSDTGGSSAPGSNGRCHPCHRSSGFAAGATGAKRTSSSNSRGAGFQHGVAAWCSEGCGGWRRHGAAACSSPHRASAPLMAPTAAAPAPAASTALTARAPAARPPPTGARQAWRPGGWGFCAALSQGRALHTPSLLLLRHRPGDATQDPCPAHRLGRQPLPSREPAPQGAPGQRAGGDGTVAVAAYASGAAGSRGGTGGQPAGEGAGSGGGGGAGGGGALPPLRAALRLLYKRVHPDLFHDQPRAKEENERSFKLLQEYVALARGGDPRSPAARLPYRFAFYLREAPEQVPQQQQQQGAGGGDTAGRPAAPAVPPLRPPAGASQPPTGAASPAGSSSSGGDGDGAGPAPQLPALHLVQLTLPPPAISPQGAKQLAGPTRKALAKLLAACGLSTSGREEEADEGGDGGGSEEDGGGPLSLAAFLPEAVEALRQAEANRPSDPAIRVANLRGALRLHHQAMVSFSDKATPPASQVALLERLARVVGSEPGLRLQGCHIVIGDRLGLDRLGHLCLAASEPDDVWAAFLTGVDMDFVLQQRRNVQGLRNLEAQVARALGVAQVFTPYGNLTEPSYRQFLERLAAAAAARGPLGGGALRDVSICGVPPGPSQPGQPAAPPCQLDASTPGVVAVSTDAAADAVYSGLAQLGGAAQTALRAQRHMEGQLRELTDKTRQRLRLRSLTRDPRVAPAHFRRACGLLLDQAAALMPLLEGCTLRIGFANRLAPDGSCIEIAHNCEL